jgi:hypothetical protein
MNRSAVYVVAALAALTLAASATAISSYGAYYVDELYLDKGIEEQGISYQGRKVPVDNASCLGLRRYGAQTNSFGLDRFWRFRCTLNGADSHAYDVQVSVTHGPKASWVYWHYLSVKRLY